MSDTRAPAAHPSPGSAPPSPTPGERWFPDAFVFALARSCSWCCWGWGWGSGPSRLVRSSAIGFWGAGAVHHADGPGHRGGFVGGQLPAVAWLIRRLAAVPRHASRGAVAFRGLLPMARSTCCPGGSSMVSPACLVLRRSFRRVDRGRLPAPSGRPPTSAWAASGAGAVVLRRLPAGHAVAIPRPCLARDRVITPRPDGVPSGRACLMVAVSHRDLGARWRGSPAPLRRGPGRPRRWGWRFEPLEASDDCGCHPGGEGCREQLAPFARCIGLARRKGLHVTY